MPTTTKARPATGRPGSPPPAPSRGGARAAICAAAGAGGWAAAPLAHYPALAIPAAVGGGAGAIASLISGRRHAARTVAIAQLGSALSPLTGVPDNETVSANRWTFGWPGHPRSVCVHYAAVVDEDDSKWRREITDAISRRLQYKFAAVPQNSRDRRRCRIRFTAVPPVDPAKPDLGERNIDRARAGVETLFPDSAKVCEPILNEAGSLTKFTVQYSAEAAARLTAAGYRARIERSLTTMLPGRWRSRWDLENDTAVFELRPTFPKIVPIPIPTKDDKASVLAAYDSVEIPYGIDEDGREAVWRPAIDPMAMVVGATGTGKTVCEYTLLANIAFRGWAIWVVDGKRVEFLGWQSWPNVQIVATEVPHQVAVITAAWRVMQRRYELIETGKARVEDFEPLVLFLDEYADFRANVVKWYQRIKSRSKGLPSVPPVLDLAASIARLGRTARVHLVFGTQRPDAEYFGGDQRDNFRLRISTGSLSREGAMMMWKDPSIGVSLPRGCRGRATTISDENLPVEIQTYYTPNPDKTRPGTPDAELLAALRPPSTDYERMLVLDPEPDYDDEGNPAPLTYFDYAEASFGLASQYPHLDPVMMRATPGTNGRELSDPAVILGLGQTGSGHRSNSVTLTKTSPEPAPYDLEHEDLDAEPGDVELWGESGDATPDEIQIGDLILVDQSLDQWGVVDAEPEPDPVDEDCIALSWRGDDDEGGCLTVPAGELITFRRTVEETQHV